MHPTRAATVAEAPTEAELPRWDVSTVWPSLDSPEFAEAFDEATREIAAMRELFDARGINAGAAASDSAAVFDEALGRLNAVLERVWTLQAYIYAFVSTDSRNAAAQARLSELRPHLAELEKLETRFTGWIGGLDVEALLEGSQLGREHAFAVRRAKRAAEHLMSEPEEALAADLDLSGAAAWGRLHSDLTSQLEVPLPDGKGGERLLPMSEIRALAYDPDRGVRKRAYEAELAAWERAAVPLAAAMNGVKGQVNTLTSHRGWATPLDEALFVSRIDRATLDAMYAAVREALPALRRYLRAKARLFGAEQLPWYDLFAPVAAPPGGAARTWDYPVGQAFIVEQFGTYSPRLRDFAARAFSDRWIDAQPRPGKSDGAFCMSLIGDESRILTNYTVAYDAVSTLAHELGHGYHNLVKAPLTQVQKRTPMTLAETASIFCETIVRRAALATGTPVEQLEILEATLQGDVQVTIDTMSRFLFEQAVFDRRRARELSVDELCELMLEAQADTYGDALDPGARHAYMWAVKPHYYSLVSFYNYPYTFGLLFGLGLYARYERDPEAFRERYDDLLASTGQGDAAELSSRFGIELSTPDFWRESLRFVTDDVDEFERLVATRD